MGPKEFFDVSLVLALGTILKLCTSNAISSQFQKYAFNCDYQWTLTGQNQDKLPFVVSASSCLTAPNYSQCFGVQCDTYLLNCGRITRPTNAAISCLRNNQKRDENVFIREEMITHQTELTLIDLELGKIVPGSIQGIPPITIPRIAPSRLQIQFEADIIVCSESSTDCRIWIEGTNQWKIFPSLVSIHDGGTMSIVGDQPIVIGGRISEDNEHGIVEIYNKVTKQWNLGPTLMPKRRAHSTVVVNEGSLVVIGGYPFLYSESVMTLDLKSMIWRSLSDLPTPTYGMACGLIELTHILCIGGEEPGHVANLAFGLDMSMSNPSWERKPGFDFTLPTIGGFIFQLRDHIYSMTPFIMDYKPSRVLRRMNLNRTSPTWEVVEIYPNSSFTYVAPYVSTSYNIQP